VVRTIAAIRPPVPRAPEAGRVDLLALARAQGRDGKPRFRSAPFFPYESADGQQLSTAEARRTAGPAADAGWSAAPGLEVDIGLGSCERAADASRVALTGTAARLEDLVGAQANADQVD